MSTKHNKQDIDRLRAYDRGMLRSTFASLFWAVISDRKKYGKLKLQDIADQLGIDKSVVSRWFNTQPNWQIDTIADLAHVLNVEIEVSARDRQREAVVFTPHGTSKVPARGPHEAGVMTGTSSNVFSVQISNPGSSWPVRPKVERLEATNVR